MLLSELVKVLRLKKETGFDDREISSVVIDSRLAEKGSLFAAVRGETHDGHSFAFEAVKRGAVAVVAERSLEVEVPVFIVENSSRAAGKLAAAFYGNPSEEMTMVGITGTNGKTSTAFLLRSILGVSVGKTGIIGTVGYGAGDRIESCERTTPDAVELNRKLDYLKKEGCSAVVMEVSSHGTAQGRTSGIEFDSGVFTNISRDHLDYHRTFDNYLEAKKIFLRSLSAPDRVKDSGTLVYNIDDPVVRKVGEAFEGPKLSFGLEAEADVRAGNVRANLTGTSFELHMGKETVEVNLDLLGSFNVHNAIAAAAAASSLNIPAGNIVEGLRKMKGVPGRFQVVSTKNQPGPTVVVDYAHTPDALKNILQFCAELGAGRVITVFGCGGDRDRGKRPIMGGIAFELSDLVYVTSDNPRTEAPLSIIEDITEVLKGGEEKVKVIADRREAIREAIIGAQETDLVVVAGKGHEVYQIIGKDKIRFSDAEEALEALQMREAGHRN